MKFTPVPLFGQYELGTRDNSANATASHSHDHQNGTLRKLHPETFIDPEMDG
jgi:hypothetical protein